MMRDKFTTAITITALELAATSSGMPDQRVVAHLVACHIKATCDPCSFSQFPLF
jgi:hypothetical protein